ncbi:MAG: hypothetical protein JWM27_4439 [Gemmatimonadetes bacterium]|nr:hypothetical protein [Gemmatimonadota bacterium]
MSVVPGEGATLDDLHAIMPPIVRSRAIDGPSPARRRGRLGGRSPRADAARGLRRVRRPRDREPGRASPRGIARDARLP